MTNNDDWKKYEYGSNHSVIYECHINKTENKCLRNYFLQQDTQI
jgi:hypothetical protein